MARKSKRAKKRQQTQHLSPPPIVVAPPTDAPHAAVPAVDTSPATSAQTTAAGAPASVSHAPDSIDALGAGRSWFARVARRVGMFLLLTAALAAWRWEILTSPPYWDAAMGLFLEADYLAQTDFDYRRLALEEQRFTAGGAAIYVISVMPTLVACAMRWIPQATPRLVVLHLGSLACGALVLLLLVAVLRRRAGPWGAWAAAAAVATTPLFNVQMDMLGMDLPMTLCAMAALVALIRGKFIAAAIASFCAFSIKITGGIATGVGVAYLVALLALGASRADVRVRRRRWIGLGAHLIVLGLEVGIVQWKSGLQAERPEQWTANVSQGWQSLAMIRYWSPDVLLVAAVALLASVVGWALSFGAWRRRGQDASAVRPLSAADDWLVQHADVVLSWFVVAAMAGVLSLVYTIPRYLLLPLPFLYVVLVAALYRWPTTRRVGLPLLLVITLANWLNLDGRRFPSIDFEGRTGAFLERSREYLVDHHTNLEVVRRLVDDYADVPIVAGDPFVHMLGLPRLGYVAQPLHGYATNTFDTPTFLPIERLFDDLPADPVLIYAHNRFSPVALATIPPPQPADRRLYSSAVPTPLEVYRVGQQPPADAAVIANADARAVFTERYLQLLSPGKNFRQRGLQFLAAERYPEAVASFRLALRGNPQDAELHYHLADLASRAGHHAEAAEHFERFLQLKPDEEFAISRLAESWVALEEWERAEQAYRRVLARRPEYDRGHIALGNILGRLGRYRESAQEYAIATQISPLLVEGWFGQGLAWDLAGENQLARTCFQQVLKLNPRQVLAHLQLGALAQRDGQQQEAIQHYDQALAEQPQQPDAINNLAWLLATAPEDDLRDPARAVRLAEALCHTETAAPPTAWDTLAAAYAAAGRFDDAVKAARRAIAGFDPTAPAETLEWMRRRLALYESRLPYRETTPP